MNSRLNKSPENMTPITYSLTPDTTSSDAFLQDVARLADDVLRRASAKLPIAGYYTMYNHRYDADSPRSYEEYVFDCLCLGTFWHVYGERAVHTPAVPLMLLHRLYKLRSAYRSLKPRIDVLRGRLGARWLTRPLRHNSNQSAVPTLRQAGRLVLWLEASGEFPEEAKRLRLLLAFLRTLPKAGFRPAISSIVSFATWFESASLECLREYTEGVDRFRRNILPRYHGREDAVFCGRARVEYHLSMTGAELMNRAFRDEFEATKRKALLVPACMRSDPERCTAAKDSLDMRCNGCDSDCAVNRLTRNGRREGFEVHIIPHSSDFTRWLKSWAAGKNIGVIGVACPLNLIRGGLELKALNIPAQCVLLNECGCKAHWHESGIPTSLDEQELGRIMGVRKVPELVQIEMAA